MILLNSILLLFSVINDSCQAFLINSQVPDKSSLQQGSWSVITDAILDLRLQINRQNTKLEHQNARLAEQDTKIAQENTRFEAQNVKLSEQNIKILEQNTKIKDLEMKMEKKGNQNSKLPTNNSTSKETGSIFTRWGRRDCPGNVPQLVYSGITGGSWFDHSGGAAEYVCLPPDPIWNVNKYFTGPEWGYMYGTEYEAVPKPIRQFKVPCAVCRTNQFSTVLMIPARSDCYQGWQEAYHGELVSSRHDHKAASQYVCLDDDPQKNGTNTNDDGKLMFPVRARCGSLPCPPYEDNTLLTCVVCLK